MSVTQDDIEANEQADNEHFVYREEMRKKLAAEIDNLINREIDTSHWMDTRRSREDFIRDVVQDVLVDYLIELRE